jgi:phage terminase large subunit-like protein
MALHLSAPKTSTAPEAKIDLSALDDDALRGVLDRMRKVKAIRQDKAFTYAPYPKQKEFLDLSRTCPLSVFGAGNQVGKSTTMSAAVTYHAIGIYPDWWEGYRFERPVRIWAAGVSSAAVRDVMQKMLCGSPGVDTAFGTGMIPKESLGRKPLLGHGVGAGLDTVYVKHVSGGESSIKFMTYEQGQAKFQGEGVDVIWLDEEPPADIFEECMTRTLATGGIVCMSATPVRGWTPLIERLYEQKVEGCGLVHMAAQDAPHLTADRIKFLKTIWDPSTWAARLTGIPDHGANGVFSDIAEDAIKVPLWLEGDKVMSRSADGTTFEVETRHWFKLWAVDFGIAHPFAAVLLAWDKADNKDVIYLLAEIKLKGMLPTAHADRMKQVAADVPVAWPHDGNQREKSTGEPLADIYRKTGLRMMMGHATFPKGGYDTEAGILDLRMHMREGKFLVSERCHEWFREFRSYHRRDGLLVKVNDDLLSATRIGKMQIRSARQGALGYRPGAHLTPTAAKTTMARDTEFSFDW